VTIDQRAHATAIRTALNASITPDLAYDADDLPAIRPNRYVEVYLARRFIPANRNGTSGITGWRLLARTVDKTSVDNAQLLQSKVNTALNEQSLVIGSGSTTPIQFESEEPIGPDDGWYSGSTAWTYVL
jgi:hypothetical protein